MNALSSTGSFFLLDDPNAQRRQTNGSGAGALINVRMMSVRDVAPQGAIREISLQLWDTKNSRKLWGSGSASAGCQNLAMRQCHYFTGSRTPSLTAAIVIPSSTEDRLHSAIAMAGLFGTRLRNPLKLEREHVLTEQQVSKAKEAFDKFIGSVQSNPERREGAYPYYLLHKPGESVYGTVLFFHGFSAKPDQMWRLAQYLFDNGFNVYQPALANHYLTNPDKNWPQVDLKPQWKGPIREKWLQDPVLKGAIDSLGGLTEVTQEQLDFVLNRVMALSPDMDDIVDAINDGDYTAAFKKYFDSTHLKYVEDAEARLKECESLPGPAFSIGLSVGGAAALALGAHQPDKIAKVVAYAPLLRQVGEVARQASLIAGPLDVKRYGWDPNLQFTVGCYAASDVFGSHVLKEADKIASIPTFLMLTENDDSADIPTNKAFNEHLNALSGRSGTPHLQGMYTADMRVPHPMVDPVEVSQNMTNRYWASLYQETFRFLTQGVVNQAQLKSQSQDSSLPAVPPV
ncbi:hypothetical protein MPTK1_1g12210 [Marchantia polymorpha subsp. ruderalis]|uniref:Serine aminopeptidase S33 domain-containing protein n=2 Tax=Marchantia polymorpha TaxID=3197 RepID=A0A176W3S4_MARPO|nr:hypothetical protein AXG93_3137s1070 [Marchantia polymorpha subsp. ruderalis]PTQ45442.1 hypothetical protein MARPO_0014s0007 [Marchantia polymorpha]BBM98277.1 hypothetical protein Mp_1g12210 [Marchantia polymorpha subsp. ruderalis]|eukprot:PTQ45442.1 hypothetical protein MARPO_0014s0007 [Marchantia polymorpha]